MAGRVPSIDANELIRNVEWVQRLARSLAREDADDLAQEVLSAATEQRSPPTGSRTAWLAGVARNLLRLRWRTRRRRDHYEAQATRPDAAPTPEELVERAQAHQLLTKLLLELNEPLRSTLLLRYYEGLSSSEIARKLRIPAGTVRWRLKRALDELRARLDAANRGGRRNWALLLTPLNGSTIAQGVLLMKTIHVAIGVALLLLLASFGAHLITAHEKNRAAAVHANVRGGKRLASSLVSPARDTTSRREADPAGALRLEGQVIDERELPVAGAEVALDANPTRIVRSGPDGAFVFERLISRDYRLEARSADGYASSVELRLTATSEPVILRITRGGTVDVLVRDAGRAPIAGAEVELRSALVWQANTDDQGHARLAGVGAGWLSLHVAAPGYAPSATMLRTSGDPRRTQPQTVVLSRGAAVSGRVVDEQGRAIAGVRVAAEATSEPFPVVDPRRDGVSSGADGSWRFDALAAGSYRFVALHGDYAPSSTPPIALDGEHPMERVELRLTPGAVVRGSVVNDAGQAVPSALVRVVARNGLFGRFSGEAFSDAAGKFVLRGLPARLVDASASSADGSSELVPVDLAAARERTITLTLSVHGAIEGSVVSTTGAAVPEARVLAEPARSGTLGEREAWESRGIGTVLADGGGRFRFVGLPTGSYRVRAVRPGQSEDALWLAPGVSASAGERDVQVVVSAEGRVRGKIVFKDGGSPDLFSVEIDAVRPEPFAGGDGGFELDAPGGRHDVVITGSAFQQARVPNVDVKEAVLTDLGTITVERGRSISGRVLDATGAPVSGAQVAGGLLLTGNGSQLNVPSEGYRVQETESDATGRYLLRGFAEDPLVLVAERERMGRSASIRVPRGSSSVEVDLLLQPTGGLSGKVTRDGQPLPQIVVIANPRGARSSNFFVQTGTDGSYAFDSLAAGDYVIFPVLGGGNIQPKDMFFEAVTVNAGQTTTADLSAHYGTTSATVQVAGDAGPVAAALVFLVAGNVSAPNLESMLEGTWLPTGGQIVPAYLRWAVGSAGARFDGLVAGQYSACAVVLPVDPNDRAALVGIRDQVNSMPMHCSSVLVSDGNGQLATIRFSR